MKDYIIKQTVRPSGKVKREIDMMMENERFFRYEKSFLEAYVIVFDLHENIVGTAEVFLIDSVYYVNAVTAEQYRKNGIFNMIKKHIANMICLGCRVVYCLPKNTELYDWCNNRYLGLPKEITYLYTPVGAFSEYNVDFECEKVSTVELLSEALMSLNKEYDIYSECDKSQFCLWVVIGREYYVVRRKSDKSIFGLIEIFDPNAEKKEGAFVSFHDVVCETNFNGISILEFKFKELIESNTMTNIVKAFVNLKKDYKIRFINKSHDLYGIYKSPNFIEAGFEIEYTREYCILK